MHGPENRSEYDLNFSSERPAFQYLRVEPHCPILPMHSFKFLNFLQIAFQYLQILHICYFDDFKWVVGL